MMNKKLTFIVFIFFMINILSLASFAEDFSKKKFQPKELKQLDSKIAKRLNLTEEQKNILKTNRTKNLKEMESTIERMEELHKKIKNVYIIGIPKFQADIKTAPMKMELALLKQKTDKIRYENRKNFENILTQEQKKEFEILKKELNYSNIPK